MIMRHFSNVKNALRICHSRAHIMALNMKISQHILTSSEYYYQVIHRDDA